MSESQTVVVKLEWESDEDFRFPLATNMVVNFDAEHFYIRFYQASPPAILGGEHPTTVKAKLVGGVAFPVSRMEGIIEALQQNNQNYLDAGQGAFEIDLDKLVNDDNEAGNE